MNLLAAQEGKEYIIRAIETDDEELNAFLFSLTDTTQLPRRRDTTVIGSPL